MNWVEQSEPELRSSLEPFWSCLQHVIGWCNTRADRLDPRSSLRSERARPRVLEPSYFAAVATVIRARRGAGREIPPRSLLGGRLLVYFPDLELADGAAEAETDGLFDVYNAPPWDTWVAMVKDGAGGHRYPYLVAWIPPQLVQLAERGIDVNPEECIQWLDRADVHLRKVIAQEVDGGSR